MTKQSKNYPIFQVDEVVESRGSEYKRIVPNISPHYFFSNPRFRSLGQVSFPTLIDYMDIYEKGDGWTLTIIKVEINNTIQYLFLPLTASIPPDPRNSEYGNPAFGIETNSSFYGKRKWQVFDAFADWIFYQKLCNLFLSTEKIPQFHVNAFLDLHESGIGNFFFHTKSELKEPIHFGGGKMEMAGADLLLRFAKHELKIYQLLPNMNENKSITESSDVTGWIEYSGENGLHLLIGVLYNTLNDHN